METPQLNYSPPGSTKASAIISPQIRLLLMGKPCSGKTWAALTAPNPIILDIDNGTTSVRKKNPNATILPFYDPEWCRKNCANVSEARRAIKWWLNAEGRKVPKGYTIVIDSLSSWQDSFHIEQEKTPKITKGGDEDSYFLWSEKVKYFRDCHFIISSLAAHVIVTCHEREIRDDKTGTLLGKVLPFMSGQFADYMPRYYTDVFHQFTKEEGGKLRYLWQTSGDNKYDLKTRMPDAPSTIEANFGVFATYGE
jgi:hypothetical protein